MLNQRFSALHLAFVALITLLITIAILRSPPAPAPDAAPTTAVNLVPKPTEADAPPTIPVYQRDGAGGLTPEAESELRLTMKWTVIDTETEALIPQAVTSIEIVTASETKELEIEGASFTFTVPVGAVIRFLASASGYEVSEEWDEMKPKLNREGTITGSIRLVPLGKQAQKLVRFVVKFAYSADLRLWGASACQWGTGDGNSHVFHSTSAGRGRFVA